MYLGISLITDQIGCVSINSKAGGIEYNTFMDPLLEKTSRFCIFWK